MRLWGLLLGLLLPLGAQAATVVTSIKPLQLIAAAITDGISEPQLLVPVGQSPHDFSFRPSDMRTLQSADVVVWVGPELENFLDKALAQNPDATVVTLTAHAPIRSAMIAGHDHADDGHDHQDHHHGALDAHIWLSPALASESAALITAALVHVDAANEARYRANLAQFQQQIAATQFELAVQLSAVKTVPYLVFHDAYAYFEQTFGLNHVDAFTVNPQQQPGAKTLARLGQKVQQHQIQCLFAEPQFRPQIVESLAQRTGARVGILDPLAGDIAVSKEGYPQFLRQLAASFSACLAPQSGAN